jgi:hypothetical protein
MQSSRISLGLRGLSVAAVTVLAFSGCEKLKTKLYPKDEAVVDQSWIRDSVFVAKGPRLLFRVVKKGGEDLMIPIAVLENSNLRALRMSKRGWTYLDIMAFREGKSLIPVMSGLAGPPTKISQGMWENAAAPLDSLRGCPNVIPLVKLPLPAGAELAVLNYTLPTGLKTLSPGEVDYALSGVPQLVAPTIGIGASQLARYTRNVRQILRKDGDPAVLAEYHDESEIRDTGAVAARRPRHLIVIMEKGVYGYRPGWVYHSTGALNDRPALRFLDSMDIDGDGKSELFFGVTVPDGGSYTLAFRQRNDSWFEMWRRPPVRCDA